MTDRVNINYMFASIKKSSSYPGVMFDKKSGKWKSKILIKGVRKELGLFDSKEDASNSYQYEVKKLDNF